MSSVTSAQSSRAVERWLAAADRAAERGQARRAWRLWTRAATSAPADGRAAIHLAGALPTEPERVVDASPSLRGQAERAARALDAHLDAAGESASAEARRALAWAVAFADHERAIELASGAAGREDEPAAALLRRLATVAVLRDDLAAARRALEAAGRALPQDSEVLSDLGAVALALGDPEGAVERFGRVLGRHPEDLDARRDLAGALVAAGRAGDAVALLAQAVTQPADVPALAIELARAALEAEQPDVAARAARGATRALPETDARGHALLGVALAAQHRRAEAEAAFEEALRRDPDDLIARQGASALAGEEGAAHRLTAP